MVLRVVDDGDDPEKLLTEATTYNVNWTGEERFTPDDVLADTSVAHYTRLRPGRGDLAIVARADGRAVGVVWLLFLDSTDPGFGYVADGVPELSVCVWPGCRRAGIGRELLHAAFAAARERGLERISLSVEDGNPARRLYEDCGFVEAAGAAPGTMVLALRP